MITVNGRPVISMRLTLPLSGLWVASLEVDSDDEITGAVTIEQSDGSASYAGSVVAGGVVAGLCRLDVVGGAGGLVTDVTARSYRDATVRTVAGELLSSVTETLDATSVRSVVTANLPYWTRAAGRASAALSLVVQSQAARWRVMPSGGVWIGLDAWETEYDGEALELDRDGPARVVILATESIDLMPGTTLGADRVGRVEHAFGRGDALRTTYWKVDS